MTLSWRTAIEINAVEPFSVRTALSEKQHPADCSSSLNLSHVQANRLGQMLTDDACRRLGIFVIPEDFVLSVVIPVYNEVDTVLTVIERVRRTGLPLELILVDDGSQDGTREKLQALSPSSDLKVIFHEKNRGKGRCTEDRICRGFRNCSSRTGRGPRI